MEHIAPLLQTLLWVSLIAVIVWRFFQPLYALLTALHKRIDAGSTIKVGPLELSDQLKPLPPVEQQQRVASEIQQIVSEQIIDVPGEQPQSTARIQSRFLQAEDLALRAVQLEYNQPVSRQVTLGPHLSADGAFTLNHKLHLVEVKFVVRPKNAFASLRKSLDYFSSALENYRWKNVKVVIAVVFQFESDAVSSLTELGAIESETPLDIDIRCYSLGDLQRRFGVLPQDAG